MAGPPGGRRRWPGVRGGVPHGAPGSVALMTLALAVAIGLGGCQASSSGASAPPPLPLPSSPVATDPAVAPSVAPAPPTTPAPRATTTTTATTRPPTTTVAPSTSPASPAVAGPPQIGSAGPAVVSLQQRLSALGYWLGTPDGQFGGTTQQAVFALQKVAGIPRTGVMDAATAAALDAGSKASPKSTSGHMIEVDLIRQVVLIVTDGHLDAALNTSTGGGYVYYDQGTRQVAITPTGQFTTQSEVDGLRISSLGALWRPKFFVGGIAIHGDSYVPPTPVSHGCVRVSNDAINWIWASGSDPIGTPVWVY